MFKNEIGNKYGKLTVIKREDNIKTNAAWLCRCECGGEIIAEGCYLRKGDIRSCGCLKKGPLPYGEAAFRKLLNNYKQAALKRNLEWSLTEDQFRELTSQNCYYCGTEPSSIQKPGGSNGPANTGSYIYNGVDRIDNKRGYDINNTVPCCPVCNRAKKNISYEDFIEWLNRITKFNGPTSVGG